MALESELAGALRTAGRSLSLRDLKKHKVDTVRVIERSRFLELLRSMERKGGSGSNERRRIERLLQELEKLGQQKKELEHARGLAEAERSRLQADVDEVALILGRELGERLTPEDVKQLLVDMRHLREELNKTQQAFERLQEQARVRLEEELQKSDALGTQLENVTVAREELQLEHERLQDEQERLGEELEGFRVERDSIRDERDAARREQEGLSEAVDALRAKVQEQERARQLDQENAAEREQAQRAEFEQQLAEARAALADAQEELESTREELKEQLENRFTRRSRPDPSSDVEKRLRGPGGNGGGGGGFGFGFGSSGKGF